MKCAHCPEPATEVRRNRAGRDVPLCPSLACYRAELVADRRCPNHGADEICPADLVGVPLINPPTKGWWTDESEGDQFAIATSRAGSTVFCLPCRETVIDMPADVELRITALGGVLRAIARHRNDRHEGLPA